MKIERLLRTGFIGARSDAEIEEQRTATLGSSLPADPATTTLALGSRDRLLRLWGKDKFNVVP